ncbi:MAG: right-handed parallel beta-helix repeat-containing protein [Deferribacteres bacterium]|nr:right-handed parallel beta-helix repeat-containing protein [Deferribacteres bacterium]
MILIRNLKTSTLKTLWITLSLIFFYSVSTVHAGSKTVVAGQSLQQKILTMQPGDTLLIRDGQYFETLEINQGTTEGAPIVLMAYPGERPVITSSSGNPIVLGDNVVMNGLLIDHGGASEDAINIRGNYNTIINCEIRNGKRDAIEINSGVGHRIENNVIHDFVWQPGKDAHGIVTDPGIKDLTIIGNTIYNCGGDCIQLYASGSDPISDYSKNVDIINNILYTTLGSSSENGLDFKGIDGGSIVGNEIYGFEDKAVVVQKGCRNLLFESNIIHDNQRGMEFRGENDKSQENMVIRYNVIYNVSDYYAVKFDWVDNVEFVNNTIAFVNARSILIEEEGLTNSKIINNVIYQADEPKIDGTFDVEYHHNGWFQVDAGPMISSSDVTGSDPGFASVNTFDFQLRANSPLINKGASVGLSFVGSAPDIGAYEYGAATAVAENDDFDTAVPKSFVLEQNWPNPFSATQSNVTRIPMNLNEVSSVTITVYNILGQSVNEIYHGVLAGGKHELQWDGRDQFGNHVAPGVYYYELRTQNGRMAKPMILVD